MSVVAASAAVSGETFDDTFHDATLRIDFYHTGNAEEESISLDRLIRQGVWAGPRDQLVESVPYGRYLVEARDAESGNLVFSKGFDSYFREYRTTGPAIAGTLRTYHETILLPFPKSPLRVTISARKADSAATPIAEFTVDPASIGIATEPPRRDVVIVETHPAGPPAEVLDVAILGEGYTSEEIDTFRADVARATSALLDHEPYASHRERIAVRGVLAFSRESGCDEPTRGDYRDTALGASFNSFGSERYLLTEDNRNLRDIAANAPYDALLIMINHDRYGGGGIYNLYCTFTAHSEWADYLLLHEFGHSFGGLADEYYSSSTAYNDFYPRGQEPEEPNITALLDPSNLKWKDLVDPATDLPTPWEKEGYDREDDAYQERRKVLNEAIAEAVRTNSSEDKVQELKKKEQHHAADHAQWAQKYLAESTWAGKVGAYEGAGYSSTGLYRSTLDCLMFSRRVQPLCPVCERSVAAMIERYTTPAGVETP
jgi:hypothetical protein